MDWQTGSAVIQRWMSQPMSPGSWGSTQEAARMAMLSALRFCKSSVVQRILSVLPSVQPPVTAEGHWVYVLLSPFWGKCYVGACGLGASRVAIARWVEHIRASKLWGSRSSRRRCGSRCPILYAAMSSVSPWHVIMALVTSVPQHSLAAAERYFIRALRPVFNWHGAAERLVPDDAPVLVDDVALYASKVLRRAHPRLPAVQWTSLISNLALAGERTLAAKLARHARRTSPGMSKVRAFPQVVIPCPVPLSVVSQLQILVKDVLRAVPSCLRSPQFNVSLAVGRVCWSKNPYSDAVVAPTLVDRPCLSQCQCSLFPPDTLIRGHVCTRTWSALLYCYRLHQLLGDRCLSFRVYPRLDAVLAKLLARLEANFRLSGIPKDSATDVALSCTKAMRPALHVYWDSLPLYLHCSLLQSACRPALQAGLRFFRFDRNPGRVIALCSRLWLEFQRSTFLESARYVISPESASANDPSYVGFTYHHFQEYVLSTSGAKL